MTHHSHLYSTYVHTYTSAHMHMVRYCDAPNTTCVVLDVHRVQYSGFSYLDETLVVKIAICQNLIHTYTVHTVNTISNNTYVVHINICTVKFG